MLLHEIDTFDRGYSHGCRSGSSANCRVDCRLGPSKGAIRLEGELDRRSSPVSRTNTRWLGGRAPVLVLVVTVVSVVLLVRAFASDGATMPGAHPAPSALSSSAPTLAVSSGQAEVWPVVNGKRGVAAAAPVSTVSFAVGDLFSVSPDGRFVLVWTAAPGTSLDQVDLQAVPLAGGPPIHLGTAGFVRRPPDVAEFRLALPAWAADSSAVAFENKSSGTVVSIFGGPLATFRSVTDAPMSALSMGGFIVDDPAGMRAEGAAQPARFPLPNGLTDVSYFSDGAALLGSDAGGNLVWMGDSGSRTVAANPGGPTRWVLVSRSPKRLVLLAAYHRLSNVEIVDESGGATMLNLPDSCGTPDISDDGTFVAYTVCDHSESAPSYSIRIVRLADGAAVDFGQAVASPHFIPGSHRLVWLSLQGAEAITGNVLSVATREVLP